MTLIQLLGKSKAVIRRREEDQEELGLSNDFMDGFREGVAELIANLTGESATDILEHLKDR